MDIKEQITRLPAEWGLVAVNGNKQPYQKDWQKNPILPIDLFDEIEAGRAKAIGVLCGTQSGGLLFLDHDGPSVDGLLASWGELPPSWMVTSGRIGRYQIIYSIHEKYWDKIHTRKFKTGVTDKDGSIEQLECRWDGCQSVVIGEHPMKGCRYRWMDGHSPDDLKIATAPDWLIAKMLPEQKAKPVKAEVVHNSSDYEKALSYLEAISPAWDSYDDWLAIGLSLHSVGDDRLLDDWDKWSSHSSKYEPGKCQEKWKSFGKRSGVTLGTLHHYAVKDGWNPEPKNFPESITPPEEITKVIPKKLEQLTSNELLQYLRGQKQEIRFNTFTQNIEIEEKTIKGAELFYLQLAEMGFKVGKELSLDCLVKVAHENEYDPVRIFLEDCSTNITPTYIDRLASTYLRKQDQDLPDPTIYDTMLKATLIGAVRRVFEPGSKHDSATVLLGEQGIRKSTFWQTLGGPFFSDSLGDISSKDDLLCLHSSWLMEWAELDHITSRKHAGQIKSFLSRSTDMFRVPYGKATEEHPRKNIIVGSTNKDTFLVDETGNRRFWVIPCTNKIDTDSLEIERTSIWSAAVHAYRNKEPHYLTDSQEAHIAEENKSYLVDSPWMPPIAAWLNQPANQMKPITSELVLTEAVEKTVDKQTRSDQMQVATILKSLGYERKRRRINNTPSWVWVPTSGP